MDNTPVWFRPTGVLLFKTLVMNKFNFESIGLYSTREEIAQALESAAKLIRDTTKTAEEIDGMLVTRNFKITVFEPANQ